MDSREDLIKRSLAKMAGFKTKKGKIIPHFRPGDTVRVYVRIKEGSKERVQPFEGVVLKKHLKPRNYNSTFTVRKVSFGIGVERTFFIHSPRIEKIEVIKEGVVRQSRLFYLRPLRGKAARIKSRHETTRKKRTSEGTVMTEEESAGEHYEPKGNGAPGEGVEREESYLSGAGENSGSEKKGHGKDGKEGVEGEKRETAQPSPPQSTQ